MNEETNLQLAKNPALLIAGVSQSYYLIINNLKL